MRGVATVLGSRGAVRLTDAGYGEMGSVVVSATDGDRPISRFIASFSLSMSGGSCGHAGMSKHCGAEGTSFLYGPLPETAFGEADVWSGLRVTMHTGGDSRLVVSYRRTVLATVPATLRSPDGGFVPVVVSYNSSGLSVLYGDELLIGNLTIDRWQPMSGWQFGWGARTSSSVDVHSFLILSSMRTHALRMTP